MPSTPRHSSHKPHGYMITSLPDGGTVEHDTHQCCHCNRHFLVVEGSGRRRGFCLRCMQVTCGSKGCEECIPFEKKLDLYEAGRIGPP